ncbi:hypothetical protein ACFQJD_09280 [Haloplanus sp. GCM10025708]|uniref:hypothetical protein n=1 Tax=Haloplanus sp. GCM10025708 TaxID=3252679 RepID=UPI00360CB062
MTHGDAGYGAGKIAAEEGDAAELVDPRPYAVGSLDRVLDEYSHLERVLPAMGYSDQQVADLEATIENADPDLVVAGTPHDLSRVVDVDAPVVRVRYDLRVKNRDLGDVLDAHADVLGLPADSERP